MWTTEIVIEIWCKTVLILALTFWYYERCGIGLLVFSLITIFEGFKECNLGRFSIRSGLEIKDVSDHVTVDIKEKWLREWLHFQIINILEIVLLLENNLVILTIHGLVNLHQTISAMILTLIKDDVKTL